MRAFLRSLLFLLTITVAFVSYADDYTPPFPLGKGDVPPVGGGKKDDDEGKGHRAPARPVFCTINFNPAEVVITGYDSADIEAFEIWDADRTACIAATTECDDFVGELAGIETAVFVVFYFDGFSLSGYFAH